jgi:adenosylmethionine-8-amino-7-oxononanoate aminotransferase
MSELLEERLKPSPYVHEIRQCGFVAGIELRQKGGSPFPSDVRIGARVCLKARDFGLLTRPVLDTVVLMPPFCVTNVELERAVDAIGAATEVSCNSWERGIQTW